MGLKRDNLRSNDKIEAMLALCHGPIKGLADGNKTFFIDETPLQNADGSTNFINAAVQLYQGFTPGETIRPLLGGYEDFRGVWTDLSPNTTLTFTTQSPGIRSIVLRLLVKQLWRRAVTMVAGRYPSDGITTHQANFTINWRLPGGTWIDPFEGEGHSVFGKTDTGEIHEIRFETTADGPFEIRITQTTADTTDAPCKVKLEGYYEVAQGQYGLTRSNSVGVQLAPTVPVVRSTQQAPERLDGTVGIDMIDIRLVVSQLFISSESGTAEDEIEVLIEAKASTAASWFNPFGQAVKIKGKTSGSPVVFEYRIPVTRIDGTYDVRVTRISGDLPNRNREIAWESLQEIVGGPARFDGVAVVRINARASNQFSSLPQFSGIYDLKLCKVPTNYNPTTRTYTGAWDGTFKLEWTDNPAWCWYDFAMDDVYGARQFWPELSVDRYSVYEAGQWCDQMVSNGKGGTQPRWTCNGTISEARGVKEQLRFMAGSFNAVMVDQLNGQIRLSVDKNTEAVALFTPENVVDGSFDYTYSDIATRYNEVTARFVNRDLDYTTDSRTVKDADHQALYGRIPFEFSAVNCRDGREAFRRAVYRLLTATTEVESVSFSTNRRGLLIEIFDTILVADPDMARALTGRIKSYTGATVTFRDALYLEPNVSYEMIVDIPDTTAPRGVVSRTYNLVGSYTGYVTSVLLDEALPNDLPAFMPFSVGAVGSTAGAPKPYRVTEIVEEESRPDSIRIVAVEINRNKQTLADNMEAKGGIIQLNLVGQPPAPLTLTATTSTVEVNLETKALVRLSWTPPGDPRAISYRAQFRQTGDDTWTDAGTVRGTTFTIYDLPLGTYDFRVGTVSGTDTAWIELLNQTTGVGTFPSDVTGLTVTTVWDNLQIDWNAIPDLDFSHYEVRRDPVAVGATWASAQTLVERTTSTTVTVPWATGAYFVKAYDGSGIASLNAAFAVVATTTPQALSGLTATGTVRAISLAWTLPNDPYLDAIEIYESATNDANARYFVGETKATGFLRSNLMPNTTRYYWVRARDRRGSFSAFLGPVNATTSLLVAADLQDGILGTAKFASGIEPVGLVSVVPSVKGTNPSTVFNTTDGKLYRWNGTTYTAAVPAADISGQLATTQIGDNSITTDKITANAITTGKIAAGAVSATEIAAGAIVAEKLASSTLITSAAQLGTAVVGTAQIANASVNSAKIGNAAITTAKINDLAVDTIKIAGNSVVTGSVSQWTGNHTSGTWTTVASVTLGNTLVSGPVSLLVYGEGVVTSYDTSGGGDGGTSGTLYWYIRLRRNGTVLATFTGNAPSVAFNRSETLNLGTFNTYDVQVASDSGYYGNSPATLVVLSGLMFLR